MKRLHRTFAFLLVIALLCAVLPARAQAAGTNVSGTVNLSTLADKAELTLTDDTTLVVDTDKTIKSISGSHALTIKGITQHTTTLTIDSGSHGISVASIDISSCIIVIDSKRDGLNIDRNVIMRSGLLTIDAGKDGIYSRNGSVVIYGGIVDAGCGTNCAAITASQGSISIDSGNVTASGAKYGMYTPEGSVTLNGTVTSRGSGWGIWSKNGIRINGGKTIVRGGAGMVTGGKITINADVEAKANIAIAPARILPFLKIPPASSRRAAKPSCTKAWRWSTSPASRRTARASCSARSARRLRENNKNRSRRKPAPGT